MRLAYLTLQATTEGQAAHAHVHEICRGLTARGHEIELFEPDYLESSPGAVARLAEFGRLQRRLLARLGSFEAVYVRSHFAALPTSLACALNGIPTVQEINGTHEDLLLAWPATRYAAPVFRAAARRQWRLASALVAVTAPLARWVGSEAGGRDAHVVPNGADVRRFRPVPDEPPPLGLPPRYVVFVGALAPWQGIGTLLDAVRDSAWPSAVSLIVVGDGVERPAVERAVAEGLPVRALGRVSYADVPRVVRAALAGISPQNAGAGRSAKGLSPLKVYETLACGVPAVVTDFPGQAELVRAVGCGLVVPPEDPHALATAVARLAEHPSAARRLGRRGRAVVEREHSWDARAAATEAVLLGVLGGNSAATSTSAARDGV